MFLDANNLYGWAMSQNFPVNGSKWLKNLSTIKERFMKNYDGNSDKEYLLEVDVEYPKNLFNGVALNWNAFKLHSDLPFLPERNQIKNVISLFTAYTIKSLSFT